MLAFYYYQNREAGRFVKSLWNAMGDQPFVFTMLSANTYFYIITDLPLNWAGQFTYTSQKTKVDVERSLVMEQQLGPQKVWGSGTVGIILLYPNDLLAENGLREKRVYNIKMEARRTHWFYYVFDRNHHNLSNPLITNHQGIEFEKAGKLTLPNGEAINDNSTLEDEATRMGEMALKGR